MISAWNAFPRLSRLAVIAGLVAALGAGGPAHACDPDKIKSVLMTPKVVNIPVGGTVTVTVVVSCTTDGDDWGLGTTITGGGSTFFNVRLVDVDPLVDDVMGSKRFTVSVTRLPVPPGFLRPVRDKLEYNVDCAPAEITGDPDFSGEGQVGCSDPADLAVEIDEGTDVLADNHYASNLKGNPDAKLTIPACCVADTAEEADSTQTTESSFLIGTHNLQDPCADQPAAKLSPVRGLVDPDNCGGDANLFFGHIFGVWTIRGPQEQ